MSLINNLNNTDFIVMLITLISMFYGYNRGLVKEILSILSLIFSGYLSLNFYPNISKFLKQYINLDYLTDALSFGILFLFIYSVLVIFSGFIAKFIKSISLEILDKNLGIIFGFIRSLFLLSIINILMIWFVWREDIPIWIKEAKSANIINYSSNILLNFIPKKNIVDLEQTFDIKIKEKMSLYPKFNEDIKKLSEPAMKNPKINSKGYSKNDNESLDQLFNIENDN